MLLVKDVLKLIARKASLLDVETCANLYLTCKWIHEDHIMKENMVKWSNFFKDGLINQWIVDRYDGKIVIDEYVMNKHRGGIFKNKHKIVKNEYKIYKVIENITCSIILNHEYIHLDGGNHTIYSYDTAITLNAPHTNIYNIIIKVCIK